MALAANSLRGGSLGQGWGSLEWTALLGNIVPLEDLLGKGQPQKTAHPRAPTLGSCTATAAIETPGVHMELKLNTHPGRD